MSNGTLGVNFFFVLSGFLITYLLIAEKDITNTINIKKFYIRRVLRIWPLFYFNVLFGFIAFPIIKAFFGETSIENADFRYYLTFFTNFDIIKNGEADSSMLNVLWSVSIEEQFYLIWPILLLVIPMRFYNNFFFATILVATFLSSFFKLNGVHTITCSSNLIIGSIFAYAAFKKNKLFFKVKNFQKLTIIFIYIITAILIFSFHYVASLNFIDLNIYKLLLAIFFALIIMEQNYAVNSFYKMSNFTWISKTGTFTYGLYCLHMVGILAAVKICNKFSLNNSMLKLVFVETPLAFLIAYIIGRLSFKFFETPFLRFKERFAIIKK